MSFNKPCVLVTGGAGYIGSHTIVELLNKDYRVVAIDNCVNAVQASSPHDIPPALQRVQKITHKKLDYHKISTLDKEQLDFVFSKYQFSVVIHFAALKAVGESVSQPLQYYENNIVGTINLLKAMNKHGVRKIIFSSSATVYGSPQYLPMDESHATGVGITNPYGQTKYMCEQIMKDLTLADKAWQVLLLRYFNPVGAHESGIIGEDPQGIPNNLVPFISQVAVGKRHCLSVFGNDYDTVDGTGVRDYIHVVDVAVGHVNAMDWMFANEFDGWKAINLGTGKGVSVLQMVQAFSKASGKEIHHKIVDRRPGDVATVVASCDLAWKLMSWKANKSLSDMCADTWRWQSQNPNGYS